MSLRDRLARDESKAETAGRLYGKFGIVANPFPASNQTSGNPHRPVAADEQVERRIVTFVRDGRSQVVVVAGTQGVGKTNFLNHFEGEIRDVMTDLDGYYMVRYLADPEPFFAGVTRRLFEELGTDHLARLAERLKANAAPIEKARGHDMRTALRRLARHITQENLELMMEWLLGLRVLKAHRATLGVQFRMDTVESKTAALRDLIGVSAAARELKGVFLLLDELEKLHGMLGPAAIVRYLAAVRSVVDALPKHLFLMIGITPDALRRYSEILPALRGRLQNQITLQPLANVEEATELARFYLDDAHRSARSRFGYESDGAQVISEGSARRCFGDLIERAERVGDEGVRQREFLHELHDLAEKRIQDFLH